MMLWKPLHDDFGEISLLLQPTAVDNIYQVHTWPEISSCASQDILYDRVIEPTAHGTHHELPHPVLLETHHVLAEILHATERC